MESNIPSHEENLGRGRFNKQQEELKLALDKLQELTAEKINFIVQNQGNLTEEQFVRARTILDTHAELLHLSITNYFGDCDKRKQKIEVQIGNNLDISQFGSLGHQLKNI